MSTPGLSPARKLRTKTSDLSDFFRTSVHSSRSAPSDSTTTTSSLSTPTRPISSGSSTGGSSSKSKRSRIPFLGRSRRKSSPEPPLPSPSSLKFNEPQPPLPKTTAALPGDGDSSSSPTEPLASTLPPLNVSPPSLASKFAAHFTPSKSRPPPISTQHARSPQIARPRVSLSPPTSSSPGKPSFDSGRSSMSRNRSPTPRPTRPAITVSYSSKETAAGERFTQPSTSSTPTTSSPPNSAASSHFPNHRLSSPNAHSLDGVVERLDIQDTASLSPSPPTSPRMSFPNPPADNAYFESRNRDSLQGAASFSSGSSGRRDSGPTTPTGTATPSSRSDESSPLYGSKKPDPPQEERRATVVSSRYVDPSIQPLGRSATVSSRSDESITSSISGRKGSRRKHSVSVVKELEKVLGTPVGDLDSGDESDDDHIFAHRKRGSVSKSNEVNSSQSFSSDKRRTVATMPYKPKEPSSTSSSKLSKPPAPGAKTSKGPPSIPLPTPPSRPRNGSVSSNSSLPTIASLSSLSSQKPTVVEKQVDPISRPRAHTTSSVPPPSFGRLPSSSSSPVSTSLTSPKMRTKIAEKLLDSTAADKENNINLTSDQLREALIAQRRRFEQLSEYLILATEKHAAEKNAMEKRIETLEGEAEKREKELQGMRYLLMNNTGSSTTSAGSRSQDDKKKEPPLPRSASLSARSFGLALRATKTSSPVESKHRKSDSISRSSTPDSQKSARRISPSAIPAKNTAAKTGLGLDFVIPDSHNGDRRSSVSSFSSSAASSTSSVSTPALSTTTSGSSGLSAIPETVPPPLSRLDPAVAAVIQQAEKKREKEERRASRAAHRLSGSSASTSSAPVSASAAGYTTGIRRGRPPSIAQVMQSPSMDDVMEKLKPFAGSTTTSRT